MLHFICSAPADASTEDAAAAHATGNGVASEVRCLHAHSHSMCCDVCCAFLSVSVFVYVLTSQFSGSQSSSCLILFYSPVCRPQVKLQVRMLTVTATVMMTMMMSASPLET